MKILLFCFLLFQIQLKVQKLITEHRDSITVVGHALNAKHGAIVTINDSTMYYIKGLGYWSETLYDKQVIVKGILLVNRETAENGGVWVTKYIKNATCKRVKF